MSANESFVGLLRVDTGGSAAADNSQPNPVAARPNLIAPKLSFAAHGIGVWPGDLKDLAQEGELPRFPPDAQNLRIDLGTLTIRFTTLDGLRGGLVSLRPSFSSTGAVVWTCG
jgi:hypothetical protein